MPLQGHKSVGNSTQGDVMMIAAPRATLEMVKPNNLQASVRVRADDRGRLARLVRYILRPPISQEPLEKLPDGRFSYRLKRPWSDGTTCVVFTGMELIEKLVALVPPPRVHQIVYHGVISSHARLRPVVVPQGGRTRTGPARSLSVRA